MRSEYMASYVTPNRTTSCMTHDGFLLEHQRPHHQQSRQPRRVCEPLWRQRFCSACLSRGRLGALQASTHVALLFLLSERKKFSVIDQYAGCNAAATSSFRRRVLDRADAKRGIGYAKNRESEHGAISRFSFEGSPCRRPQRGPVTDVNLPRGLRGGESLDDPSRTGGQKNDAAQKRVVDSRNGD
jgi:hypothetical protein